MGSGMGSVIHQATTQPRIAASVWAGRLSDGHGKEIEKNGAGRAEDEADGFSRTLEPLFPRSQGFARFGRRGAMLLCPPSFRPLHKYPIFIARP